MTKSIRRTGKSPRGVNLYRLIPGRYLLSEDLCHVSRPLPLIHDCIKRKMLQLSFSNRTATGSSLTVHLLGGKNNVAGCLFSLIFLSKMMKSKNILVQEEEFLKLNAEIDSKTEDLMTQVEQIKEIQLSNEKLYSNWTNPEQNPQIEMFEINNELEIHDKSSEDSFALNEYFSRRKDENPSKTEGDPIDSKTERRNLKVSHSAKITPSIVTNQGQESTGIALGITRHKSDVKPKQGKPESDVIPETLKGVGNDGIMRFLSAKVKLLSEQLESVQRDEKKHLEKIKDLQAQKDKLIEERDKLLQQANTTKNVLVKYEKHVENTVSQLQTAQTENSHLKRELETLKKEMRQNNKNHNANEIKLNRTLEEVERLKSALQQTKQEDKEFKEHQRKKMEDLTNAVKSLDKQRAELLNGFKKQLLIIDNLKRQRGLIEAGKLLKSAEDDFINYLECNPPNTTREVDTIKSAKC